MWSRFVPGAALLSLAATLSVAGLSLSGAAQTATQTVPAKGESIPKRAETIVIFPFENSSRMAKLDWLGEGLAELTIERLAGQGTIVFSREERLAVLEKMGLPVSTRPSRATMLKIAEEIDADYVVFGQYASDGKTLSVNAQVLRVDPPALTFPFQESGALEDLMDLHARLVWRLLCYVEPPSSSVPTCGRPGMSQASFLQKLPRRRLDAFEYYIRGLLSPEPEKDEQSLRLFREAARLEPAWEAPAFALGQAYLARRDCEAALAWLSRVPSAHERGPEASFDAGVCHLLRNDPARAEAALVALLERLHARPESGNTSTAEFSEFPEALNNLAVARGRLGKAREAIADLQRATRLDPEEADYWFNLGLAELRTNDSAAAIAPFREVLRRQAENVEARALLIAALERSGHSAEAAAEREAFSRSGGRPAVLSSPTPAALARLDHIKTRLDVAALRQFPEAATEAGGPPGRRPRGRQLHVSRGRQFLAAGKLEDAQREFNQAILLAPLNSPAAHLGLAEVFRRQGRRDDAVREIRAALASREDAAARTTLARIYLEQNRKAEAREELRLALKLDPGYPEARQLLEQLEAQTGPGAP
jgi:tetratricopeptide (TPR) repeat protein